MTGKNLAIGGLVALAVAAVAPRIQEKASDLLRWQRKQRIYRQMRNKK